MLRVVSIKTFLPPFEICITRAVAGNDGLQHGL